MCSPIYYAIVGYDMNRWSCVFRGRTRSAAAWVDRLLLATRPRSRSASAWIDRLAFADRILADRIRLDQPARLCTARIDTPFNVAPLLRGVTVLRSAIDSLLRLHTAV